METPDVHPNPIMPRTVATDTLFCFGPISELNLGLFFDDHPPGGSRIGAVRLYRTSNRLLIRIDARSTPGTIVGILRAGRITLDGSVGVIGDGGDRDWTGWFTRLFSRVDGIRKVIGSSSPAPRGAIEAGISAGIQTVGFGLEGEVRHVRAIGLYTTVEALDAAVIATVLYRGYTQTALEWLYQNPPDPMWARYRAVARVTALVRDRAPARASIRARERELVRARAMLRARISDVVGDRSRGRVSLPTILISVCFDDGDIEAAMFFTGRWEQTFVPSTWTTWTEDNMTIRADSHKCHVNFRRPDDPGAEVARPDPSVVAGIIAAVGHGGVVAVLGHGNDTYVWSDWFKELFGLIPVAEVISVGDYGPALGSLVAATELGLPTGGYIGASSHVDNGTADGSGLEAEFGLTAAPGLDSPFITEYALLTGETTTPPTYVPEALGPGRWEDDVVVAPAPPGYDERPPAYDPE